MPIAARRTNRARERQRLVWRRHQKSAEAGTIPRDGTPTVYGAVATDIAATTMLQKLHSWKKQEPKRRSKNDRDEKEERETRIKEKKIEEDFSKRSTSVSLQLSRRRMVVSGATKVDLHRADECHIRIEDLVPSKSRRRLSSRRRIDPTSERDGSLCSSHVSWSELYC